MFRKCIYTLNNLALNTMESVKKRCLNEESTEEISIVLCSPKDGEECPISSESIGSTDYIPPYSSYSENKRKRVKHQVPQEAFTEHPNLYCAQMECGHRFDSRALLIHFMRNAMKCPMCRAGVKSNVSCKRSFPEEKWLCEVEGRIAEEIRNEEEMRREEDAALAGSLQNVLYFNFPSVLLNTLNNHVVSAALFFYDTPIPVNLDSTEYYPIHAMRYSMDLLPLELHHRDLSRGISLYSSFSSESISSQHDDPSPITNNDNTRAPATYQNENTIETLLVGGDINLSDISIRYTFSDATLR